MPAKLYNVRDPEGDGKRQIKVKRRIDRLDWFLAHTRQTGIQQHHYEAGRILQSDWEGGERLIMAQLNGSGGHGKSGDSAAVAKIESANRYGIAIGSLPPEIRRVVEMLLIDDKNYSLERVAAVLHIHGKAALPLLRSGLDILAKHYGLI